MPAPPPLDFAPFAKLKALLNLEKASLTDYPALAVVIDNVRAEFESYMERSLDLGSYTESWFQEQPTDRVYLHALPIISVDTFLLDDEEITSDRYVVADFGLKMVRRINDPLYYYYRYTTHLRFMPILRRVVTVTYTGGYDADTYDKQIEAAAIQQVCYEYGLRDNIGATTVQTDGGTVTRPQLGLLTEVQRKLDSFKTMHAMGFA